MNEKKDVNYVPAIITLVILSLIWGITSDFGDKYGSYLSTNEVNEIQIFISIILAISFIVFLFTKDKKSYIGQITKNSINQKINNKMESEISEYIKIIKGIGDEELGLAVLSALTLRKNILVKFGIDLMDPIIALQKKPNIIIMLSKTHEQLTAQKKPHLTVPYAIWAHTLRSVNNPTIRSLGRTMWSELSRGFKHVEDKKETYEMIYGNKPNTDLAGKYPIGLDPSDIENNTEPKEESMSSHEQEKKLLEYVELHKKGLITKDALSKLQVELLSQKEK